MGRGWLRRAAYGAGFLACALAVAYPAVSNCLYERNQSHIIVEYDEQISTAGDGPLEAGREACRLYNEAIRSRQHTFAAGGEAAEGTGVPAYEELLNITGDGIMGYLEIPKIGIYLPVYHDATESVLEEGIGHLPESSLPVGGEGTHAVLTGHTGMSDKRLFTDLPDLETGDIFVMHVLGEELYYEVDRITTVLPYETDSLLVEDGEDYMTLVTCTPFGVNSHRLLVRGTRIDAPSQATATDEPGKDKDRTEGRAGSVWLENYLTSVVTAAAVSAAGIILSCVIRGLKRKQKYSGDMPGCGKVGNRNGVAASTEPVKGKRRLLLKKGRKKEGSKM